MAELKPCPFCGASGDGIQLHSFHLPYQKDVGVTTINMMYCTSCGGAMIDRDPQHCYNDLYKNWNRRADNG